MIAYKYLIHKECLLLVMLVELDDSHSVHMTELVEEDGLLVEGSCTLLEDVVVPLELLLDVLVQVLEYILDLLFTFLYRFCVRMIRLSMSLRSLISICRTPSRKKSLHFCISTLYTAMNSFWHYKSVDSMSAGRPKLGITLRLYML